MIWFRNELASIPNQAVILFGVALLISGLGFYQTVYFISIGYGFAIAAMSLLSMFIFRNNLGWYSILHGSLLAVYGIRLGVYLVRRELQSSYSKERKIVEEQLRIPITLKILVWIGVSILYVLMFSPSLFSLTVPPIPSLSWATVAQVAGLLVMSMGVIIEALADQQKSRFKSQFPKKFCNIGIYQWVRCPNYLGEIIFWLGNWIMGLVFYTSALRWLAGLVGLICIVLIMMGSTKRLESAQDKRYGHLPEYQAFTHTVPVLFPYLPIYSLKNVRVYLE